MRYIVLALYVGFSCAIFAQSSTVKGTVKDEQGEPLLGASVIYRSDVSKGTIADENGAFFLEVPQGKCKLICRYTGMKSDTISFDLAPNEEKVIDFTLFSYIKEFKQVDVKVGKFDKPIEEQTVTMIVLKPELIENKNTRSIETALDQTPGLNILDGEPQIRGGSGFTFGVGSKVAVIVDDMPMLSGDAGRPEWGFIPVENISQIEVVKGAASVLSGSSALSGSVNIRTAYPTSKPKTKINIYNGYIHHRISRMQVGEKKRQLFWGLIFSILKCLEI